MNEKSAEFSLVLLFPWVKGRVSVTEQFVKLDSRNTFLGFIPAGVRNESMPLHNISSVSANRSYNTKGIIIGVVIMLAGLLFLPNWFGALLLVVGLLRILENIQTVLTIQRSGADILIYAPFYEKKEHCIGKGHHNCRIGAQL